MKFQRKIKKYKRTVASVDMNVEIEQPSRVIELSLPAFRGNEDGGDCSINFYGMDAEVFRIGAKKPLGGYIRDETLKDGIGIKVRDKPESCVCKHPVLDVKFYKEALKNDIRVRLFKMVENSIVVNFMSIEDAISFRMQYSHVVKMRFIRELVFDLSAKIPETVEFIEKNSSTGRNISTDDILRCGCAGPSKQKTIDGMHNNKPFLQPAGADKKAVQTMTESDFYSRVEFFSKMKGVHSKSDIQNICVKPVDDRKEKLDELLSNAKALAVGSVTNVAMQSIIKEMTEDELCQLIKSIGDDISAICATKYGAYTIQTLIIACTTEKTQYLLCKYFGKNGKHLFSHEIGNYSIQRILLFNEDYVFDLIKENLKSIISNKLGIKVVKRCVKQLRNKRAEIEATLVKIVTEDNMMVCKEILSVLAKNS